MTKKISQFSLLKTTICSHLSACLLLIILLSSNLGNDLTNGINKVEAWGSVGHRTIASIALSYSSDETKAILKKYNKAMNITSIVDIADWADAFSRNNFNKWSVDCHFLECASDHETEEACYEEWEKVCSNGCCVPNAVNNYSYILMDPFHDTKYGYHVNEKKVQDVYDDNISVYDFTMDALKFLVHFLGDIHQPFHVSFSDNSGANYIHVQFMNHSTNMHSLWDTDMITYWEENNGGCIEKDPIYKDECNGWRELSQYIQSTKLMGKKGQDNINQWRKDTNPWDWAKESHSLVHEAYKLYSPKLGIEYYDIHFDILCEQLAKAGIRLATRLDRIFAGSYQ